MKKSIAATVAAFVLITGCATDQYGNRRPLTETERGALIGGAAGALLGGLGAGNKTKGLLIGAVGGGIAGGLVGSYMDRQKQDLERVLAPERRHGDIQIAKLEGNVLRVNMTNQTAFDFDSSRIKPAFEPTMDKIANVLVRYGKTHLVIIGYTDNVGSPAYNQRLSERRAQAVDDYFRNRGVIRERLDALGRGERDPRASNATAAGRQLNRRVEILIEPIVAERG